MRTVTSAGCLATLVLLQGCTSLNAVRVDDGKMQLEGAPYNLTFTQYDLTVKRRLTSCFEEMDDPVKPGEKKKVPNMKVTTTVEATRKEARDPSREYVIDFAALRSFFKTTDIAVEYYDNGALKSVNASVTDKTGEFLKSSFTAAAKVAMLGTGIGAVEAPPDACFPKVNDKVLESKATEDRLEEKTAALKRQTEQLEKLQAVAVALGPTRSAAERREFAEQVKVLYLAKAEVDKEQKALAVLLDELTFTSKVTWPLSGSVFAERIVAPLVAENIEKWGSIGEKTKVDKVLEAETSVYVRLVSDSPSAKHVLCADQECEKYKPVEALTGLKYRLAMPGTLKACSNESCVGPKVVLFKDAGMFSQLGPIMSLPLRNYPFMTQTVVLTMNEAGQPTKLGYKSEANAEKAMDVLNTFVDEYGKVRQAKKPKSEEDLVKEETALLEAKAKLKAAKAALEPSPTEGQTSATEALKADTALLEAELAKLKAQAALDEAKKQGKP